MIKPISQTLQLSSAKTRSGLTSISDLIPRLIKQYEMQAELARQLEAKSKPRGGASVCEKRKQATFSWYE